MPVSNRTLAKNTAFLYTGTLVNLLISLYTSRVVLNTLGVVDYGIYSVVGSVISMVTVINMLMSLSTSRFLSIELGRNDETRLADTFSSAMIGQIILALIVVVLLETVGVYMLNTKIVIPSERMFAAQVVFQLSILSMFISNTQQPYNAAITAREHFGVYTIMGIVDTVLKLVVIFLLILLDYEKLILYSLLLLAVTAIMTIIYRIYCIIHFPECKLRWHVDRKIMASMLKYSFWTLLGSSSKSYSLQGTNMILNMFFGPVLNAANSIAMTVEGSIIGFSFQPITAFRFQIVKAYAANELQRMCQLIYQAARYSTALFLLFAIPMFFEVHYVLTLWLGIVPDYTVVFIRTLLIAGVIGMNVSMVGISIGATPYVKKMNIIYTLLFLMQLPVIILIFKSGGTPVFLYLVFIVTNSVVLFSNLYILCDLVDCFSARKYLYISFIKNTPLIVVACLFLCGLQVVIDEGFFRLAVSCAINLTLFALYFYFFVLDNKQRNMVLKKMNQYLYCILKYTNE